MRIVPIDGRSGMAMGCSRRIFLEELKSFHSSAAEMFIDE
jgi:hypothetical protein